MSTGIATEKTRAATAQTRIAGPGVTWQIDPSHTNVEFAVRHLMISKVKGRFAGVSGTIVEGVEPGAVKVDVTIDASTIDTRDAKRDAHLTTADFLDVAKYPTIAFAGRRAEPVGDGRYRLLGDLTMRGVTREVTLDVTAEGRAQDPWGNERTGYSAKTKVSRKDFGLEWNVALEAGGVLVGDEVEILIEAQGIRQSN